MEPQLSQLGASTWNWANCSLCEESGPPLRSTRCAVEGLGAGGWGLGLARSGDRATTGFAGDWGLGVARSGDRATTGALAALGRAPLDEPEGFGAGRLKA